MNNKGFTLIELIMVIILLGILSATAVVLIGNVLEQQRTDETLKKMQELVNAMAGNPELTQDGSRASFGYTGDMGVLPPTTGACTSACGSCGLVELVNRCTRPLWTADAQLPGTGYGWRGPYIDAKQDDSGRYLALLDGWGNYFTYNAATGQITSYGPNGVSGGGDDIVWPGSAISSKGAIGGRVTDKNGNSLSGNNVIVTHPNPSSPGNSTTTTSLTDASGFFNFTGTAAAPIGRHKIQTTVITQYTKSVTVLPNQSVNVDFGATGDPTTPNPPTAVTATRATLSSINLTWTPPTTNTDGSTLVDLVGYEIWRSVDGGTTYSLLQTVGLVTSFSDTGLTAGQRYLYRMKAVDRSGNKSVDSSVSSTTVSPIRQSGASAFEPGGNEATCSTADNVPNCPGTRIWLELPIINTANAADTGVPITVTSMVVEWNGGGSIRKIKYGGTNRYCSTAGKGSGSKITLTTSFTMNAGDDNPIFLYWCDVNVSVSSDVRVQFNTVDGRFSLY